MFQSYLKIAFRNFRRFKAYSFINIIGLAVGLASALVIGLWVHQEWSYDRHFHNAERIYRIGVNFMNIGDMAPGPPQFSQFAQNFPEVEKTAQLDGPSRLDLYVNNQRFTESLTFTADSAFFNLFSYDFVEGDLNSALNQPDAVVLTSKLAQKYFGDAPALGKVISIGEEKTPHIVTGIVNPGNGNSHINADLWLRREATKNENWQSANGYNYVLLKEGLTLTALQDRLRAFVQTHVHPALSPGVPYDEWIKSDRAYRFIPIAITDIYLTSNLRFEPSPVGDKNNVVTFGAIAILIILIASVNYVNITTARASVRAKEVGVRKSLGSGKSALAAQFLSESFISCGLALLIALGLGELFLKVFEWATGLSLMESLFATPEKIIVAAVAALVIGLLAGLYPAFYLTTFKPISALKGKFHSPKGGRTKFRNALVLLQFTISTCLLISAGVVFSQLEFMRDKDQGLQTDNVLIVSNARLLGDQKEAFKQALLSHSGVENASYNHRIPAGTALLVKSFRTSEMEQGLPMQSFFGDYKTIPTIGFKIIEGRNFSRDLASDSAAVILNESAVKALSLQNPVGAILNNDLRVIGVVTDFNFESMRNTVEPAALTLNPNGGRLAIKLRNENARETLTYAQSLWASFGPVDPMSFYFLDENFERLMEKERVLSKAVLIFTILAIFITCLGLYGLSAYMAEQRTKEIGVRKVLGATVAGISALLSKNFVYLVLLANLIAWPVAWFMMNSWLQNFAYRTEISWLTFALSGGLTLAVALLTVSSQAIRAALANPAKALRYE